MRAAVHMSSEAESAALCRALRLWAEMVCLRAEVLPWDPGQGELPGDLSALFWDMDGAPALPPGYPRGADGQPLLFLCASDSRAAIESYALHPAGFFKKPVRMADLRQTLSRCIGAWWDDLERVEVLCGGLRRQIPLYDLLWVESSQHGSLLHTSWEQIQTREPLRDLEARLPEKSFLRCQRSFLVSLYHTRDISQTSIGLSNGDQVPVGRRARASVLEACRELQQLWGGALLPGGLREG